MGSRMLLLLVLALLVLPNHSQGVPETQEQSSIVHKSSNAADVGEALTRANPVNTPRKFNRECNCTGMGGEIKKRCRCEQPPRRKQGKLKRLCQRPEKRNLKVCSMFFKQRRGPQSRKYGPSVPI